MLKLTLIIKGETTNRTHTSFVDDYQKVALDDPVIAARISDRTTTFPEPVKNIYVRLEED